MGEDSYFDIESTKHDLEKVKTIIEQSGNLRSDGTLVLKRQSYKNILDVMETIIKDIDDYLAVDHCARCNIALHDNDNCYALCEGTATNENENGIEFSEGGAILLCETCRAEIIDFCNEWED